MPPKRKKTHKNFTLKKRRNAFVASKKDQKITANIKQEITCDDSNNTYLKESLRKNKKIVSKRIGVSQNINVKHKDGIKCKECNKIFKFENSFRKHCINEHSKRSDSVACPHCNAQCPDKDALDKHIEKTHNRVEYLCPHCQKSFVRRSHVLRHMAQSGCDGTEVAVYPCEICKKEFSRKDNLIVHLRYQHILKSGYTCKYCPYATKNFSKLVNHWQLNHLDPRKFECDICGKTTSSRTSIAKHLEIHGEKKRVCGVCGYRTFTTEVMKRHVLTHARDKPHKCDKCGQSYIQKLQLQRHIEKKHTGHICSICSQTFNSKASLLIHERTHLGLQNLVCPFEDCALSKKVFPNEKSLQLHIKTHLDKRGSKCEVCGKGFYSAIYLRRHLTIHRLDRPRRCMYCMTARAYIRGEQLLRHVRRHHPDMFVQHLEHVRNVMGKDIKIDRVSKSELESILNLLDVESERILEGYGGSDVLYGGMQDESTTTGKETYIKMEDSPLMSEVELEHNLSKLLSQLIDEDTLQCFGWPDESLDNVLEKVIEQVGARAADRSRWTRVQCLRENTKQLFLYAVEDKAHVARMLDTHTIDQIVKHVLTQVDDPENANEEQPKDILSLKKDALLGKKGQTNRPLREKNFRTVRKAATKSA